MHRCFKGRAGFLSVGTIACWAGWLFVVGADLRIVGCLAADLASPYEIPVLHLQW